MQSDPGKQYKNQIAEKKFYLWSDFELIFSNAPNFATKLLQRFKFWIKIVTTRQIVIWKFYGAWVFEGRNIFKEWFWWKKD